MLIDFSLKNYLSIRDEVSLNFESDNRNIDETTYTIPIEKGRRHLYPFSVLYGANASGKSNIIKALADLAQFVTSSHRADLDDLIPCYKPFRLDKNSPTQPTKFQLDFVVDSIPHRYRVEFLQYEVLTEELHFFPKVRPALLFRRKGQEVQYGERFKGEKKAVEMLLLKNKLLLSLFGNSANELLHSVYRYFRDTINIHAKTDSMNWLFHETTSYMQNKGEPFKKQVLEFLSAADLSIENVRLVENEDIQAQIKFLSDALGKEGKHIMSDLKVEPQFAHKVFDEGKETEELTYFDLDNEESTGTAKIYDLAGEVITVLQKGFVLIIDEFNSGLHPYLCRFLVELFMNPIVNKKNAQLLIASHDVYLLDYSTLKREQIWFTEKDKYAVTELFSMDEFEGKNVIRDNAPYSKFYLGGRFGAVPAPSPKNFEKVLFNVKK